MHDLRPFVGAVARIIARHALDRPGAYALRSIASPSTPVNRLLNPYGCADAANLLYTLDCFPSEPTERATWVEVLRSLQDPSTGLYQEASHHAFHCTAHCVAALELFDARPIHRLTGMHHLLDPAALHGFLDSLKWQTAPWGASHLGAGVYAALVIAREASTAWEDAYFSWLWEQADPVSGYWRKSCVGGEGSAPLFHHLAGSFHYLFNHQHARRPLRYPGKLIDTTLELFHRRSFEPLGRKIGFAEIDWVYMLTRASRQTGHRFQEVRETLQAFAEQFLPWLLALDWESDVPCDDLHGLFGTVCCLAELQAALPGQLRTERPLRLVLDRRPFI